MKNNVVRGLFGLGFITGSAVGSHVLVCSVPLVWLYIRQISEMFPGRFPVTESDHSSIQMFFMLFVSRRLADAVNFGEVASASFYVTGHMRVCFVYLFQL